MYAAQLCLIHFVVVFCLACRSRCPGQLRRTKGLSMRIPPLQATLPEFITKSFFGKSPASSGPHAEFRPVPAAKQAAVIEALADSVTAMLSASNRKPSKTAAGLVAQIGKPDFYHFMARTDRSSASWWNEMIKVQQQFAAAEPGYDPKTRAYSESMRLTLHAAVIQHFEFPALRGSMSLYERFIELHPTAFYENGGWFDNMHIPLEGAWKVLRATPIEMTENGLSLLRGAAVTDAATQRAADWVRKARASTL